MFVMRDVTGLVEQTLGVAVGSVGTQASSWAVWGKTLDLLEIQFPLL